jgi:NADPH-dependent glutamate synthase beta subunit-like oxidoreductase
MCQIEFQKARGEKRESESHPVLFSRISQKMREARSEKARSFPERERREARKRKPKLARKARMRNAKARKSEFNFFYLIKQFIKE